jgi:RNA polymerase subunit RPABC4/transcription elongation factor Spt4
LIIIGDGLYHILMGQHMPFCRGCGKQVQVDWASCPYCSSKIHVERHQGIITPNTVSEIAYPQQSSPLIVQSKESSNSWLIPVGVIVVILVLIAASVLIFPSSSLSDLDGDGFANDQDWYDSGNGGLSFDFTVFDIWEGGYYDSGGGNPDVYAYVQIGDGGCNNMQAFEYLDKIHEDATTLRNWESFATDIPDDWESVCVSITIYDEDSWAPDEILDFVPGNANYYQHKFDLKSGEGDIKISEDNRGENELSIRLAYEISRVAVLD